MRPNPLRIALPLAALGALAAPAAAQDSVGVRLQLRYEARYEPGFVVLPFGGSDVAARAVRDIVRRDLEYSDRFEMKDPAGASASDVDAAAWRERGADWVLQGTVEPGAGGL